MAQNYPRLNQMTENESNYLGNAQKGSKGMNSIRMVNNTLKLIHNIQNY